MASSDSWIVQTGFGTVLGPMPTDTLREMVHTRELLPTDLVRLSSQETWQPAAEIAELFPKKVRVEPEAPDAEPAPNSLAMREAPAARVPTAAETQLESRPVPDGSAGDSFPVPSVDSVAPSPVANEHRPPATLPVINPVKMKTPASRSVTQSPWIWISGAVPCVLLVAIWCWPRSPSNIYPRLVSIWNELHSRRDDPGDTAGWEQFLSRANSELDQIVPWLENHASPDHRELQLLLFASRDSLRVMLQNPRSVGSPQEKRLLILFQTLQELHERASADEPRPLGIVNPAAVSAAKESDPETSGSSGIIDPSRLRLEESGKPPAN